VVDFSELRTISNQEIFVEMIVDEFERMFSRFSLLIVRMALMVE